VYYLSPSWPYHVNSFVSLDGNTGDCVDLQDNTPGVINNGSETVKSRPVWHKDGLSNTRHTVRVSACAGAPYIVVDGFM
jgi:hypothetical protein